MLEILYGSRKSCSLDDARVVFWAFAGFCWDDDRLSTSEQESKKYKSAYRCIMSMRPQPMVVVRDVEACSKWFQQVLGLRSGHGGTEYEMLMDPTDGSMVTQLHKWDVHDHPHLGNEQDMSRGNGILLWYTTDDFEALVARVKEAKAKILDGPLYNPNGRQEEIWLEGPEGYKVVVAGSRK